MMVTLPAVLIGHELWAAPMAVLYAVVAGTARWVCPDKEEIWKFSGFIDLSLYRSIKQRFKHPALDWQVLFSFVCILLEIARMVLGRMGHGKLLYYVDSPHLWVQGLIVLATLIGVGLPVRIWNNTRIERKLVEQEKALIQARVDALISQINPHFLFNTLNTVSSLIRFDPDTARTVLLKLANILRRRLKSQMHFVPLKQELEFIDDYLDIEVVRFGRDKLQIRKEIAAGDPGRHDSQHDPPTLAGELHPAWNRTEDRGRDDNASCDPRAKDTCRSRLLTTEWVFPTSAGPASSSPASASVMSMRRLKVLYGQDFSMRIESQPGKGTAIRIEIPELVNFGQPAAVETAQVAT